MFENVSFSYDEGNVLKNINLTIPKGKTLAMVGASGSGKSTLSYLIPRFYEISSGRLLMDGIEIKDIKLNSLRQLIAYVSQETVLYNDTIRNNILFGLQNKSDEEIVHASTLAHANDFIIELPEGYDTIIGDAGSKLSGGQRQRIALARAILKDAPIIILDEATSALDTNSEKIIQNSIETIMKHKTCLVIAHRLSTVQHANEIVVLDKGEIVERGTHAELLEKNGFYKRLCDLQEIV
ncbi:MAG: ATP-binding cassette domain-containing protein [Bacteroidetes bacterium]|nr:ATP-binding cassette domain-containing protein [Bacteroidota bacterium]